MKEHPCDWRGEGGTEGLIDQTPDANKRPRKVNYRWEEKEKGSKTGTKGRSQEGAGLEKNITRGKGKQGQWQQPDEMKKNGGGRRETQGNLATRNRQSAWREKNAF